MLGDNGVDLKGAPVIVQMPFGNPTAQPGEKEFQPVEYRVTFYN